MTTRHKLVCYFVMNNGCIEEENMLFETSYEGMKSHLKPLFVRVKVKDTTMNKIIVDRGVDVNIIPHLLLRKIGKYDIDLKTHDMVLSNYEGKIGHMMVVIQVDVMVESIT